MLATSTAKAVRPRFPEALLAPAKSNPPRVFSEPSRVVPRVSLRKVGGPFPTSRKDRGEVSPAISLLSVFSPGVSRKVTVQGKRPDGRGIDLEKRGVEVRKLFYAAFARGLVKDGYDPEEALQEVYRGLLARNLGTCPFDEKKSSFGHYVHIVARCVLANYIRKEKRRGAFETNETALAPVSGEGGGGFSIDSAPDLGRGASIEPGSLESLSRSIGGGIQVESALRLLTEGYSRKEVLDRLGVERSWLDGILATAKATLVSRD